MDIMEEEGGKKARCSKCGQVVLLPGSDPGLSPLGRLKARTKAKPAPPPALEGPTKITGPPPGVAEADSDTRSTPALQDMSTRADAGAGMPPEWTACLRPAEAEGEIGRLGPYRVLRVVGAGGMGVVFEAEDPTLERRVALKAMLPHLASNPTARERFLREARAAAKIQHDRVAAVYQVGEERGVPWLAMPFLVGEPLDARLRRVGELPAEEVARIGAEIAEGLMAIHERGLIHRDIKPANLWLEASPGHQAGEYHVKILDFGLARATAGEVQLTQAGAIVGSPAFMAPEQAGRQPVDARADLFALGCVLYLMCTGVLPFEGDDAMSTLMAIASAEPIPPHQRNPQVPAELSDLVMEMLAKKPQDRPTSAREVREALLALS
jgi:serine/threonine protein kinase